MTGLAEKPREQPGYCTVRLYGQYGVKPGHLTDIPRDSSDRESPHEPLTGLKGESFRRQMPIGIPPWYAVQAHPYENYAASSSTSLANSKARLRPYPSSRRPLTRLRRSTSFGV